MQALQQQQRDKPVTRRSQRDTPVTRRSPRKQPGMSPGSVSTSRVAGCRVNNSSAKLPETTPESLEVLLSSTTNQWDCAFVNPYNTLNVLKHTVIIPTLGSSKHPYAKDLRMLNHAMVSAGYITSGVLKEITFAGLDKFMRVASVPIFLSIKSRYTCVEYTHIIGVIPVMKGQHHSHIVDGSFGLKTFPFTENNLIWCCGGCISAKISEFIAFIPGKKLARREDMALRPKKQMVHFWNELAILEKSEKGQLV